MRRDLRAEADKNDAAARLSADVSSVRGLRGGGKRGRGRGGAAAAAGRVTVDDLIRQIVAQCTKRVRASPYFEIRKCISKHLGASPTQSE